MDIQACKWMDNGWKMGGWWICVSASYVIQLWLPKSQLSPWNTMAPELCVLVFEGRGTQSSKNCEAAAQPPFPW